MSKTKPPSDDSSGPNRTQEAASVVTDDRVRSLVVELISEQDFSVTLNRIVGVIEEAGMRIFARIDHALGAREVGLEMTPTILLLYGHPRGGTPIMQAAPQAALELPLRVLLYTGADGSTHMIYHPIATLLREAKVPDGLINRLDAAQQVLHKAFES
jgi:uncharacterized protein (DUF302 family)